MPPSADWPLTRRWRLAAHGLAIACFLPLASCGRDLSIPPAPPPVSCRVRVTVTVVRDGRIKASVTGARTRDAAGNPATGVALSDDKDLVAGPMGQSRTVEFLFPIDASIIQTGTWDFNVKVDSIDAMGAVVAAPPSWATKCSIQLRQSGLNRLDAQESQAACTGDFVTFGGAHEVGIEDVRLDPLMNRVGERPAVKFIATNSGESRETFQVQLTVRSGAGALVGDWTEDVTDLRSGDRRPEPVSTDPPIIWNTSGLTAGDYVIEAKLKTPVMDDRMSSNDRDLAGVTLSPGDTDGDGIFDEKDNCPTVANPLQETCDREGPGNACATPKITSFRPDCAIAGGADVVVQGFGFANVLPTDITLGTASAASIVSQTACQLVFRNPANNPNPWGTLKIATIPPTEAPTCCLTPKIDGFSPSVGAANTVVTVLGCGLSGARVLLEPTVAGGQLIGPFAPEAGSTADILQFRIPTSAIVNTEYYIRLSGTAAPGFNIKSARTFRVQ